MRATIAICTWNRADLLGRTLAGLRRLLPLPEGVEVLVVDNNSCDRTAAVVRDADPALAPRYVLEPEQGLAVARNRALREARGELLLWLDDDVEVQAGWLAAYLEAAAAYSEAAFFGGPIRPVFLAPAPAWLTSNMDELGSAFAARDLGDTASAIGELRCAPFGANMAIRKAAILARGFDPRLGRHGSTLLAAEERRLFAALLDAGLRGRWVPPAAVDHLMPADRLTLDYVRRYFHGLGRSSVRLGSYPPAGDPPSADTLRHKLARTRRRQWVTLRRGRPWAQLLRRRAEMEGALEELEGPVGPMPHRSAVVVASSPPPAGPPAGGSRCPPPGDR